MYDKNILLYDSLFINHIRQHDDDNKSNSKSSGDSDMLRCYGMIYDHIQYSNKANFSMNSNDDNISVSNNSTITSMSTMSSSNNAMVTNHSFQSVSSIMLSRLFSIQIYLQMNRLAMMYIYIHMYIMMTRMMTMMMSMEMTMMNVMHDNDVDDYNNNDVMEMVIVMMIFI
jgi:hypothetical protein